MMLQSLWPTYPVDFLWCTFTTVAVSTFVALLVREIDKRPNNLRNVWRFMRVLFLLLSPILFFLFVSLLPHEFAIGAVAVGLFGVASWASWVVTREP